MSNQGNTPPRYQPWSSEWIYQEMKDVTKLKALRKIGQQQEIQTNLERQRLVQAAAQAEAQTEQLEAQTKITARHAGAIEAIEREKLAVEKQRLQLALEQEKRSQLGQELRVELCAMERRLVAIRNDQKVDQLSRYITAQLMLQRLDVMPIKAVCASDDLVRHGKLTDIAHEIALKVAVEAREEVEAFARLIALCEETWRGAVALDLQWQSTHVRPLVQERISLREQLRKIQAQKKQLEMEELNGREAEARGKRNEQAEIDRALTSARGGLGCGIVFTIITTALLLAAVIGAVRHVFGATRPPLLLALGAVIVLSGLTIFGLLGVVGFVRERKKLVHRKTFATCAPSESEPQRDAIGRCMAQQIEVEERMKALEKKRTDIPSTPFQSRLTDMDIPTMQPAQFRMVLSVAYQQFHGGLAAMRADLITHVGISRKHLDCCDRVRALNPSEFSAWCAQYGKLAWRCGDCRTQVTAPPQVAGRALPCPRCGSEITIPDPLIECQFDGERLDVSASRVDGTTVSPVASVSPEDRKRAVVELVLRGERRDEAENWVSQVCRDDPQIEAREIVQAVYRLKAGIG